MNNNTELFNYSISNQRKEMQKQQLKSIKGLNKFNNDTYKKKSNITENNKIDKKNQTTTNSNLNPNIDKYKQIIIGGPRTEEKIVKKNKINKEGNHEEYIKNQDNSMMINQIYNKKIIENTKETKELLTGGKQNNN